MRSLHVVCGIAAALSVCNHAQAELLNGSGFAVLDTASGELGCLPRAVAQEALTSVVLDANQFYRVDPDIAVLFSLDVPTCSDLFYLSVSNDVEGIGYQHLKGVDKFDDSPDSALSGIVFLNDLPYWLDHDRELKRSFLHEVGHRYTARVHVSGMGETTLLGRDEQHWSAFLDSQGSPLGGNSFAPTDTGYRTKTAEVEPHFSPLDLYLMGVLPPEQVGPFSLLRPNEDLDVLDCDGRALTATSDPQYCGAVDISAEIESLSVDDVIAAEGPRQPAARDERQSLNVVFYYLAADGQRFTVDECQRQRTTISELIENFAAATDSRLVLENAMRESPCGALDEDPSEQTSDATSSSAQDENGRGTGCSWSSAARQGSQQAKLWWLLCVTVYLRRLRTVRTRGATWPTPS